MQNKSQVTVVAVKRNFGKSVKTNKSSDVRRLNSLPDIAKYTEKHKITIRS